MKLLLGMAALACAIGLTVKYGSAYRPVVEPVREIEAIWAIEDEREDYLRDKLLKAEQIITAREEIS